jgi:hypothetical protein
MHAATITPARRAGLALLSPAALLAPSTSRLASSTTTIHYDADADKLREVIDRSLAARDAADAGAGVPTARREGRSLYRAVLRASRAFTWLDEGGTPWRHRLVASARAEFEATAAEVAAGAVGPEEVARRLVVGRAAVAAALEKVAARAGAPGLQGGGGGGGSAGLPGRRDGGV